jgi:hypothetical protein
MRTMIRITTTHHLTRLALLLVSAIAFSATVGGGHWG